MRRIGLIVFPDFQLIGLTAATVFELANAVHGSGAYDVSIISENGGPVRGAGGVAIQTQSFDQPRLDTILVVGGASRLRPSLALLDSIRSAAAASRRIASTCTGAFLLADAGLLEGKRVATHWLYGPELQRRHPGVRVDADHIFVTDGAIWTSAGMTAVVDLVLAMIEEDLGATISRAVARQLVVYHRRSGGQSQHSALLELEPKSDGVRRALAFARQGLRGDLSVERLASMAGLSPRQFSRVFHREIGRSPAKVVEQLRVEAARLLIETEAHSIEQVVRETGFSNREQLRRAFLRILGEPPQAVRRAARLQNRE